MTKEDIYLWILLLSPKLFCRFIVLKLIQQIEIDLFYNNQS